MQVRRLALVATVLMGCGGSHSPGGSGGSVGSGGSSGSGGDVGVSGSGGANGSGGDIGVSGSGGGSGANGSSGGVSGSSGSGGGSGQAGTGTGGAAGGGASGGGVGGNPAAGGHGGVGGGAPVGGAGGAGGGAGGTGGCPYKLCEGFESGTPGGLPTGWTSLRGYDNPDPATDVALATDQVHGGVMSLKSDSSVPGQNRVQKSLAGLGATATKHWGRIFYRMQSPAVRPSTGNYLHTTFVALEGTTEDRIVDTVEQSDGTHQWLFNVPDDSCCTGSDYDWTFDASWHCAEWYVDLSTESYRFFSDGAEVTSLAFTGNAAAKMSAWTALAVGAIFYQTPSAPIVAWFDDLAIDDNQIGCQ